MLKRTLLFIFLLSFTFLTKAQTFYWVGGSGYWNDINHWSYTSGGTLANTLPPANANIIFDNNSGTSNFTIHALHTITVKTLTSQNTLFNIDVIGSPEVDFEASGTISLNEHFYLKTNGKIILDPQGATQYGFGNNRFHNDIYLNASSTIELGTLNTIKSLYITGNLSLNNTFIFADKINLVNSSINLTNTMFQAENFSLPVSGIAANTNFPSKIITNKTKLSPAQISYINSVNGINLSPLAACTPSLTPKLPKCSGDCNGEIIIDFSGCTDPPYDVFIPQNCGTPNISINGISGPTFTVTGICGCVNAYVVQVTNALGEVGGNTTSIGNPPSAPALFTPIQPNCFNACNGSIILRPNFITAFPITVAWSNGVTHTGVTANDTLKNICAGPYTVTTTNANGCIEVFTTTLTQPTQLFANGSSSSVTCNGSCNGSALSNPSGGTPGYTYSWVSASSTPSTATASSISNLCPGVVTLTVTDSKTCTAVFTASITQPPAVTLTVTKTDLNCGSVCNGTGSVTATGGIGSFTYSWSPSGGTGSSASGLCAGIYTVTVTNNGNCVKTITLSILTPPTLTATPTQTNILCNAACTGSINLHPSGGTTNYSYTWVPAVSSTSTAANLCVGAYNYTVTDALGCKFSNTVTITQPPPITLTVTKTDVTCFGACNGTATGNVSGGTGPYTYSWTASTGTTVITGQGTPTITNICAPATFTLRATDVNGCFRTATVSITQPTQVTANHTTTPPTCNGACNGSITSVPSGGTGPYTFTLQTPTGGSVTTTPPFTGLCAGTYTLVIRDNNNCLRSQIINLTQPNPITLSLSATPLTCFNSCNSTISSVINGGTPSYTVSWGPGITGSSINNQCAGTHTATVTDSKGCQATASVNIASVPDMTITASVTQPNCNAQCTGIATATVTGGTPNYGITWSNGPTGNVNPNLCAGNYTVTVIDFLGCTKSQVVTVTTPPALTLTPTNGSVSCSGSCDGSVSVLATGGTAGYFYNWNSVPSQTTSTATGLCPNNYVVNVTDSKGCISSTIAVVSQPPVLTSSVSNVQPSCNVCIGAATANGFGGVGPYTYSWSPGTQTVQTPTNLCIGSQTVIITDANGCTTTQTVQIVQSINILITANSNTLACNGSCSGVATANASGGTGPGTYSYTWTPAPVQSSQTATGLCAGITHTVTVQDMNGCSNTNTVSFVSPPAITLTVNKTNVSCNALCDGTASALATGGTGTITYLWAPGNFTTSSISNLCAGDYTVTATDVNGCNQTQVVTITENPALTASFTFTSPTTCTSSDGILNASVSGGTPTYTVSWLPGGSTSNPLTGQPAGTYSLVVIDAAGCTQTLVTTLSNPTGPTVTVTSNSIACFGSCTGSSTLSISGTPPFSVNWPAPVSSTNTIVTNLCAGLYVPQITDGNGCITNQTLTISQPLQLISTGNVTNVRCNSVCSASINLTTSGGTGPFTYTWSPAGGNVEDPTGLCAGNYTVDITDANGCTSTNTFVITEPPALTISFNKKDVLCNGGCTGGVRAVVGGGLSPYSYTWTPAGPFVGSSLDTLINLCSGVYTVTATDANGCTISGTVSIGQPTALTSTITSTNIKCNNQCNGTASITAAGGIIPYSFSYNTTPISTPTQSVSGLCVGSYTGTVTDVNGCTSATSFSITEPLPIVITTTVSNPKCNAVCNGSVATTVTGGNPGYSYNWITTGGPVANPFGLCAGMYTVVVTDDSLCTGQAIVTLVDPPLLISNTTFTNPSCNAGCDGIVSATPVGGIGPFNYSWSAPTFTTQTVTGLCAGVYTLTLTDANGCQDVQTATLVSPPAISINPALSPATCGSSNGSIDAVALGGTPAYTYNWLPPISGAQATSSVVTGIPAGIYTVVVTDAGACSSTITIPLSNSNGPSGATITSTNVTCNGQCNGAADISNPVGGTPSYTLSWINPVSTNTTITGLCAGTYTAQIEDANNCLFFQSVNITQPQLIDDNEVITSASCFGICNGAIALNPTGGNGGYTYSWTPSASTGTITNLCPGVYTATITDNMGCTLVANHTMPSLTTITSSTFATNNVCFGECNGSVLATNIAGGVPPYTFNWSGSGQSTNVATGLCNGSYSVTITDANGCFNVIPATITSPSQVTLTPTVVQPGCGLCNGSANITTTGGTPGYSLSWSNSQTGSVITNLCAGVYMAHITDGNGCQVDTNIIINSSSTITGETIVKSDVTCAATTPCDGSVTVTAIGGVGTITYHWTFNNSPLQTQTGLCAGTYFCNMTDANGCTRTASVVIGATTNFTITPQIRQSSCSASTGSITLNVSGGAGSYTFVWTPNVSSTNTATGLAPGSYSVTISDGNCSQTQVYSMSSVNGPQLTFMQDNLSCAGICDGSIGLNITGGSPGYTIAWSNGANTNTISSLCAGAYSVEVTDVAGCKAVQNFSLSTTTPIVFSVPDLNNPLCNNNCDGSITTIPTGGTLPYTFSWTPTAPSAPTSNSLCTGNYSVTIVDVNGCTASETYTLTGPTSISITATVTDAVCNGAATGAIDVTVTGGTPGYIYTWTPGITHGQDTANVVAGTYSVLITDANGCNVDSSFVVNEPAPIVDNEIITSAACFGNCNGSIALTPTGGQGSYTYSWTPPANTGTITNLCPGAYTGTITDNQGCTLVTTYTVLSITTITSVITPTNNNCYNNCNGVLSAGPAGGGVAPYTYQWASLGQGGTDAFGLCNGTYSVTITDANGCFNMIPGTITSPSQVTFTPNVTQPGCGLCDGSATITPTGGTPNYTLSWSNAQTGTTLSNLCAGVYMAHIVDGNGCQTDTNIIINSSSTITGETIVVTDVTCSGSCDGTANVTAVGGTAPITYFWLHNNSTAQNQTGLCAGIIYYCNMKDANGCIRTASVVVGTTTNFTITPQITQSSCTVSTGSISVNVTGGTGSYTYVWNPNVSATNTATGLAPGSYSVTVSDGNCSQTVVYSLGSINGPVLTSTQKDISCSGICDGNIAVTINGGTPGYTTLWSNGATTPSISTLCSGSYSIQVTDAAGCIAVKNFSLSTTSPIVFSTPDVNNPLCNNACDGSITTIPSGGSLPYVFNWTPVAPSVPTATNLCSGNNYSVTIVDVNGCSASESYTLTNPAAMTLTAVVTDASCSTTPDGAIDITVGGGSPAYSYSWTPGSFITEDLTSVLAGTYSISITDQNGCKKDSTIIINAILVMDVIAGNDTTFCQNGTLILDGSNSVGGVTYQWFELPSPTAISNTLITTVTPSAGTTTYVLIGNNNGCIDQDSVIVTTNALPVVDAGPFVSIPLLATTTIGGNPTSATGVTYTWSPGALNDVTITNPTTTTTVTTIYTVTVTDANGCFSSDTVTVFVYPEIIIPNGFSNNGDGKNDVWQIDNIDQFPDNTVEVYNRWGELLFYSQGYAVPFDGKYKGKNLPVGTYYYVINLNSPEQPKPYTGPLTIFR